MGRGQSAQDLGNIGDDFCVEDIIDVEVKAFGAIEFERIGDGDRVSLVSSREFLAIVGLDLDEG